MIRKDDPLYKLHSLHPMDKKADALRFLRSCAEDISVLPKLLDPRQPAGGFLRTATASHLRHLYGYTDDEARAVIDDYIVYG